MTGLSSALALLLLFTPMPIPLSATERCRCAQRALEQYFADAEVVLIGRVTAVRREAADAAEGERNIVTFRPLFRAGQAYKGDLTGLTFSTSTDPAACGVPVAVGQEFLVFATVQLRAGKRVASFNSCSGSRRYPAPNDASGELFLGLSARDAVVRLAELADAPRQAAPTDPFHTSPACWREPRIYHQGTLPAGMQAAVTMTRVREPLPDREGVLSPNRAYRAFPLPLRGDTAVIVVDDERPMPWRITVIGAAGPVTPQWVSEKLLFFRIMQGRVQFTDALVDVELGRPIYLESARDGTIAFEQFREGCLGQCPCLAVPGSADSLAEAPRTAGLPLEMAALQRLAPDNLAHLDADWDGRVFSEAGGVRYTRSQLYADAKRSEHPIALREVSFVNGGWWLRVELYAEHPCNHAQAAPVHAGWVPAFAKSGHLVAATSPGGC